MKIELNIKQIIKWVSIVLSLPIAFIILLGITGFNTALALSKYLYEQKK